MFGQNFDKVPVFCDPNHCLKIQTKNRSRSSEKLRTTIERQKNSRYEVLRNRRFKPSKVWDEGDDDKGYQSDESSDSRSSSISLDQISLTDILRAFLCCKPVSESETILNTAVSAVMAQMEINGSDFDAIEQIVDNFFTKEMFNKISTFIGSKGVRHSLQIKIIKMYDEFVNRRQMSGYSVENVVNSSMVSKLIEIMVTGNEGLVEASLNLLLSLLENNSSVILLSHVLNSGFVDVMIMRAEVLQWKSPKAHSEDLKTNLKQLISVNNFSPTARVLFKLFARAVYRLLCIDMEDWLRADLLTKMTPLFNRLFSCPDILVTPIAIDCLKMLVITKNTEICSVIDQSFSHTLFAMTDKTEDRILFSVLSMFNTLMASFPHLLMRQSFGLNLITSLERIVEQKRNNHKLEKEIIEIIASIAQSVNLETVRPLSHRIIRMSSVIVGSYQRYNRLMALQTIETVLYKYSFESLLNLLSVFDLRGLITKLLVSDSKDQTIGMNICDHLLKILSHSFNDMSEEVEKVKHLLFGRASDTYYCLEKLSFKTCNGFMSNRANYLLKRIDSKLTIDEDLSVVPQINENGFVFGPNI